MSSSTSERSIPLVTHVCIVCSQEFQQRRPIVQFPPGPEWKTQIKQSSQILDEFSIFFGLQCLNLSTTDAEKLFGNLVDAVGEPGNWDVSFCPQHSSTLEKALEVDLLIKRLQNQLKNIKAVLGTELSEDFRKESEKFGGESKNVAYQMIRKQLKSALSKSQSSSESVSSTNKTATVRSQRKKKRESSKQTEATAVISELNETELKPEVDSFSGGEDLYIIDVKYDVEEEQRQNHLEHDNAPLSATYQRTEQNDKGKRSRPPKSKQPKLKTIKKTVQKKKKISAPNNTNSKKLTASANSTRARRIRSSKCKFCQMTFTSSRARDDHITDSHNLTPRSTRPYVLATITKSPIPISPSQNIQSRIQQRLRGQESWPCFNCQEEFPSSALVNRHKRYCDYTAF